MLSKQSEDNGIFWKAKAETDLEEMKEQYEQ